ncbi:MAG: T9SS type A sorting domain-containing protein, partial [Bacteroidota bacterium]
VGNHWQFYDDSNPSTPLDKRVLADTLLPNGLTYARIKEFAYNPRTYLQRCNGSQVFQFNFAGSNSDQLIYDFARSVGDTVAVILRGNDRTLIILSLYREIQLFGRLRRQWGFFIDFSMHVIDDEQYHIITDSLGLTLLEGFGLFQELRGAIINGVTYGTITGVGNQAQSSLGEYNLDQNYPNPFNPVTTFQFSIVNRDLATLKVYDVLGREVATLVNEVKQPGTYTVQWDASNMSSGLYLCRLSTTNVAQTRKLLLLR